MADTTKYLLDESKLPKAWYNINADMPVPPLEARAVPQLATFEAATTFACAEGIVAAPESAHAVRVAIDEALACKESGEQKVIAFNLSGHGHFDMMAYQAYFNGELEDYDYPAAAIADAMSHLPEVSN